jgi:lipopolysaccharide export system permease protein
LKKLDKLVLKAFIGPFFLTFLVVVFVLLNRQLLFYYDDIIGKGLSWMVLIRLVFYFAMFMLPHALPLAILLSSLICFGNLAEHQELTAVKSAGISLLRVLRPVFVVVLLLTAAAFHFNNSVVPKMALSAYTLLYDIKQKKPSMELREGVFYGGLPDISIKVNRKFPDDDAALKDVILYDHQQKNKTEVWLADSGRMYTIADDHFLMFELFNGIRYEEGDNVDVHHRDNHELKMSRTSFDKTSFVVDLSSFTLMKTDPKLFGNNRMMKNRNQLKDAIDTIDLKIRRERNAQHETFHAAHINSNGTALEHARKVKAQLTASNEAVKSYRDEKIVFEAQRHRIFTNSFACIVMFLIGAPLGAIIRKGGLGTPVLVSILFFLVFFVLDLQGEKLAKSGFADPAFSMWLGISFLLFVGVYLLVVAKNDSRLFEGEQYSWLTEQLQKITHLQKAP